MRQETEIAPVHRHSLFAFAAAPHHIHLSGSELHSASARAQTQMHPLVHDKCSQPLADIRISMSSVYMRASNDCRWVNLNKNPLATC